MNKKLFFALISFINTAQAIRLRFILINDSGANLFASLRTNDSNPLDEVEMRPGEAENIYTNSFNQGITRFYFNIKTNSEETKYLVVYDSQKQRLYLERGGIIFEEASYSGGNRAKTPPVIRIDKWLDGHFDNRAIYEHRKKTGMNTPNKRGYKPSLAYGDSGHRDPRTDRNWFCPRGSSCRHDLERLPSYVGISGYKERRDNLNPFCRKKNPRKSYGRCGGRCQS